MIYEKQPIGALLVFSLFSLLPAQTFAQSKQNSQSKSLVFTHVTIIDATGAPARPDLTVVVSGERIIGLGKTREESVTFLSYCFFDRTLTYSVSSQNSAVRLLSPFEFLNYEPGWLCAQSLYR